MEPDLIGQIGDKLQEARLSFEVIGSVIFGSFAGGKATGESDLDLLVVGLGLPEKLHRRARQIAEIKRTLPDLPLDVSLLTQEETFCNFANHNPLFLDIAEDGILLFDRDGTLAEAMQETRQYVRERGITRIDGGWRFPVEPGVPTYLSRVSTQDFARGRVIDSTRDLAIGRRLVQDAFYDKAVYHFQQSAEKAVKAVLIALGVFQKSHLAGKALRDVLREPRVPGIWQAPLLQAAAISEELEPEHSLSRYPGIVNDALWLPSEEYTQEDAEAAGIKAGKALEIAQGFMEVWFARPSG